MPVISDFIFGPGASVGVVQGAFVRFTNNLSGAQFVTAAPTSPLGLYTLPNVPPGTYTVATGPTAAGPWTTYDPNYIVGDTPGDHILTSGTAPSISGVNAGISGVPTVVGNDQSGLITFTTTGAPPGSGINLFTVNFAVAYVFVPAVFLIANSTAQLASYMAGGPPAVGSFTIQMIQAPVANTTYVVAYFVVQPRVI